MKRKATKRSISNKNSRNFRRSLTPTIDVTTITPNQVDLGIGTAHLDSHAPCLKGNLQIKPQKALKRDLLRCGDQRPSLLGSHTLQPPRIHNGSQQSHTPTLSRDHPQAPRRHSLTMNSRTFYATIDRIGPWPDVSISRLRSDGNELLRPLKNFRSLKNPRVFSPKYYAALSENTSKFKFYSSTRTYIDEYRKQKGYLIGSSKISQANSQSLSASLPMPQEDDDQVSGAGTFSSAVATDLRSSVPVERTVLPTTDVSLPNNRLTKSTNDLLEHMNTPPSIPAVTKVLYDSHHMNNLPIINMRNGHLRPTRHPPHHSTLAQQSQHQQSITLPSLTASSLHYLSSMNSIEKAYANSKKSSTSKQSKVIFIDDRNRKRISQRFNSDSELSNRSQDLSEIRATGGPVASTTQRPTAIVVYQLPRRTPPLVTS